MLSRKRQATDHSIDLIPRLFDPEQSTISSPAWPALHPLGDNESLYFLHIPKTAGTSLYSWLTQRFAQKEYLPNILPWDLVKLPRAEIESKRLIFGHFGISFAKHYPPPNRTITWLRNPIDRTLSQYFFYRETAKVDKSVSHFVRVAAELPIAECLKNEEYAKASSNLQAIWLGSDQFCPSNHFVNSDQLLNSARKSLAAMEFVGFVEHMQASIDMMNYRFGWRPSLFNVRINSTPRTSHVCPDSLQAAAEINQLDQPLYDSALAQFTERFEQFIDDIQSAAVRIGQPLEIPDKITLQDYNSLRTVIEPFLWQRYAEATQNEPREHSVSYTFDLPLRGEGWGDREGTRSMVSYTYRWMLQKEATIDIPVRRDIPLKIRFRVAHTFGQPLSLFVDDLPVEITKQFAVSNSGGGTSHLFEGILPPNSNWDTHLTTISFQVPRVIHCGEIDPTSQDNRSKGVAIDWISVEP